MKFSKALLLTPALLVFVLTSVQAEDNEDDISRAALSDTSRVIDIDEVIVVAQTKEAYKLRQQPISSTSFSAKDIDVTGASDLRAISAYIPSFTMPDYGSRLTSAIYVRGTGSRINSPAVGIYSDGIPIVNKNAFNCHIYQVERIDVLRGPQGTLYGQNTEGGLVRIYSKSPMSHQGTELSFGLGTDFERNVEAAHYGSLGSKTRFSIAAFYDGTNGFLTNSATGSRADNKDEAGAKARLIANISPCVSIDYVADYQYVRQNGFAYGLLNENTGKADAPSTNYDGCYRRNIFNTGLTALWRTTKIEMSLTSTYQFLKDYMLMDQDYTSENYMHLEQRQLQNALTEELTVRNRGDGSWQWVSGLFASYQWLTTSAPVYFDECTTQPISSAIETAMNNSIVSAMTAQLEATGMSQAAATAAATAIVEKAGGIAVSTDMYVPAKFHTPFLNLALFHETNLKLTKRLTATLSLRYDHSRASIDYDTKAIMAMTADVMGQSATYTLMSHINRDTHNSFEQLLPKVGLRYNIDGKGSNVYALMSKGYRAGGYNIQMFADILQSELMDNSTAAMSGDYEVSHTDSDYEAVNKTIAYDPETSWNYEIGVHANLFGGQVQLDMAAYLMNINDLQLTKMSGNYGYGRMMVNAGRSRSMGVELSLRSAGGDNHLTWAASYGLTNAEFRDYEDTDDDGNTINYRNKRVPYVPAHTLGMTADYRFDLSNKILHSITIGANMAAQGKTYWDEENTISQSFYTTADLRVRFNFGKINVGLWGKNITDTNYCTFATNSSATGTEQWFAQRGRPLQIGFDVKLAL